MTTLDPTIQRVVDDAELEEEMEALLANKPSYRAAVPGTNPEVESGRMRALQSTAAEMPIYNRETGEMSMVIFDALKARMRQRFPDDHPNPAFRGQKVYSLHAETVPSPIRGELACPLSAENSDRSEVNELGFGTQYCPKPAYFMTEMDVELHVEKSHPRFYARREKAREAREREEMRQQQAQLNEALLRLANANAPTEETKPKGRSA